MKEKTTRRRSASRVAWESLEKWARLEIQDWVQVCSAKSRSSGTRSSFLRITPVANTDTKLLINGLFQKG